MPSLAEQLGKSPRSRSSLAAGQADMAALLVATLMDEELCYHIRNRGTFLLVERSATGSGQLRHLGMSPTAIAMEDDMMERLLALSLAGILVAPPVGLAG